MFEPKFETITTNIAGTDTGAGFSGATTTRNQSLNEKYESYPAFAIYETYEGSQVSNAKSTTTARRDSDPANPFANPAKSARTLDIPREEHSQGSPVPSFLTGQMEYLNVVPPGQRTVDFVTRVPGRIVTETGLAGYTGSVSTPINTQGALHVVNDSDQSRQSMGATSFTSSSWSAGGTVRQLWPQAQKDDGLELGTDARAYEQRKLAKQAAWASDRV